MDNFKYNLKQLYLGIIKDLKYFNYRGEKFTLGNERIFCICKEDLSKNYALDVFEDKKYPIIKLTGDKFDIYRLRKSQGKPIAERMIPLQKVLEQFSIKFEGKEATKYQLNKIKCQIEDKYNQLIK